MKSMAVIAAALALLICTPALTEPGTLTVRQSLQVLQGLRALDGRQVIVKVNGQDTAIMKPWDFGSGQLRLAIANDIAMLTQIEQTTDKARVALIKSIAKDGSNNIEPNTPEHDRFMKQWEELLNSPAPGGNLIRIEAKDLRLDVNEISGSTLAAILPIMNQ